MNSPKYSIVIPVYNRPEELTELLESIVSQTYSNFEVIVIEDGSTLSSETVVQQYQDRLRIEYFFKFNSGPGPSRNVGFQKANGEYFVVFDSDCLLPPHYFESIEHFLTSHKVDSWGGPDRGHSTFTLLQQAMAHTMSSFFTTGGIRGGTKMIGKYQPRSFNMGISRETFLKTGGFHFDRFAEDIDLSIRMKKLGLQVWLIPEAFVFHKRRANLIQFFQQVYNFGKGRVMVGHFHPGEVKWVHWFPAFFLGGIILTTGAYFFNRQLGIILSAGYVAYLLLVALDGARKSKSISIAILAIPAVFTQMMGYGAGFLAQKIKYLRGNK